MYALLRRLNGNTDRGPGHGGVEMCALASVVPSLLPLHPLPPPSSAT